VRPAHRHGNQSVSACGTVLSVSRPNKTGGGPGTNQYKVRGQAKKQPKTLHDHLPHQVVKRGDCVWLRGTFDDIWCLKHRQLAPELRQLMELEPCVARLGPKLQIQALGQLSDQAVAWMSPELRLQAARCLPPDQLQWVAQDPDYRVRAVAAYRMPAGELQWATQDEDWRVRRAAANRMPPDQLGWAAKDQDSEVRRAAVERMPPDQLGWATKDKDLEVRQAAAHRMLLG
jgi:hypothetical protein